MATEAPWIYRLAEVMGERPLSGAETNLILGVAHDVAHLVERKVTPVSTFLLGLAVGRRLVEGGDRSEAIGLAVDEVRSLLPGPPPG